MTFRGLPKNQFGNEASAPLPAYGTVEYIDGGGSTGTTVSLSQMEADEYTYVCHGVSGLSYMYSLGRNNDTLEVQLLEVGLNGSGAEAVHLTQLHPYASTAGAHSSTVGNNYGSGDNPAWCRARFRATPGFRGIEVRTQRINQTSTSSSFTITPATNPMTTPGGLCIAAAFKDFTAYPDGVSGTGWSLGGNGGLTIQAYYILSTTEVETPGNITFTSSGGGNQYWVGALAYIR